MQGIKAFIPPTVFFWLSLLAPPLEAVEWNAVTGTDIILFYPGQASWEWVLTADEHSGAKKFKDGKPCTACHQGEQQDIGNLIVSGKKLEPKPIKNKPGTLALNVKAAYDKDNLYFQLTWAGAPSSSGVVMDKDYASKVTVMLDDGHVNDAMRAGCWSVCHDDAVFMPNAPKDIKISKYLVASRTKISRSGGGENFKSQAELDQLLKDGIFLEYLQAKLNPAKPAVAADGYILDKRVENKKPLVTARSELKQNKWQVELTRPLLSSAPEHKNITPGTLYRVNFAIHDDHAERRFHHVSFLNLMTLGTGNADIVAKDISR